jgi:hypothetical protein
LSGQFQLLAGDFATLHPGYDLGQTAELVPDQLLIRPLCREAKYRFAEGILDGGAQVGDAARTEPCGEGLGGGGLALSLALHLFHPQVVPTL